MAALRRVPPADVRRALRREVGFGCPVPGCGSPYLTWHHFDPPWHERQHHDLEGMVALCRDHHPEADAGAFTSEQLRQFKTTGRDRGAPLGARFNWMRNQLVAVVGGNFYVDCPIAVQVHDIPVVWFGRDSEGSVLVNLQQLTTSGAPRMVMLENFWITEGQDEHDIGCPPSGRIVKASYPNGDRLKVEFQEHESPEEFGRRFPPLTPRLPKRAREMGLSDITLPSNADQAVELGLRFPMTTVAIEMTVAGTPLKFGARSSEFGGSTMQGVWMRDNPVGVQIGDPDPGVESPEN